MTTELLIALVFVFAFAFTNGIHDASNAIATLVFGRLLFVFTVRGDGPFWAAGRNLRLFGAVALSAAVALVVLVVPAVGERFGTTDLTGGQWLAALSLAAVPFVVPELFKLARRALAAAGPRSPIHSTRDAMRAGS